MRRQRPIPIPGLVTDHVVKILRNPCRVDLERRTGAEIVALRLMQMAMSGNLGAIALVMERSEGRLDSHVDLTVQQQYAEPDETRQQIRELVSKLRGLPAGKGRSCARAISASSAMASSTSSAGSRISSSSTVPIIIPRR